MNYNTRSSSRSTRRSRSRRQLHFPIRSNASRSDKKNSTPRAAREIESSQATSNSRSPSKESKRGHSDIAGKQKESSVNHNNSGSMTEKPPNKCLLNKIDTSVNSNEFTGAVGETLVENDESVVKRLANELENESKQGTIEHSTGYDMTNSTNDMEENFPLLSALNEEVKEEINNLNVQNRKEEDIVSGITTVTPSESAIKSKETLAVMFGREMVESKDSLFYKIDRETVPSKETEDEDKKVDNHEIKNQDEETSSDSSDKIIGVHFSDEEILKQSSLALQDTDSENSQSQYASDNNVRKNLFNEEKEDYGDDYTPPSNDYEKESPSKDGNEEITKSDRNVQVQPTLTSFGFGQVQDVKESDEEEKTQNASNINNAQSKANSVESDKKDNFRKPKRKQKKKRKRKKKSTKPSLENIKERNQREVGFLENNQVHEYSDTNEDDENTIHSDQTSHHQNKEQMNKQIPPKFVRYRLGASLENDNLLDLLVENDTKTSKSEPTVPPAARFRKILMSMVEKIKSLSPNACFISWKNDKTYSKLRLNPDDFPKEVKDIAIFFNGFKAKMRDNGRVYFSFCLHLPRLNGKTVLDEMAEWASVQSYTFYQCDIQAEKSKVIGWLVYSFEFSNVDALKQYFMSRTNFEWGFKITGPIDYDKNSPWKDRTKALQVMVPAENEEIARGKISETFQQRSTIENYKKFSDCYIYIGNHREHKHGNMKIIFDSIVRRHEFHKAHINLTCVSYIIKDIDIKTNTAQEIDMSLREMILNIPSNSNEYGSRFLYQSVDYTQDFSRVWWNGSPNQGSAGYILSFFEWDANEALEVSKGLGAYLGRLFGKSGIYDFFTEKHWEAMKSWEWCDEFQKFSTPEARGLAHNVIYDPTVQIMERYQAAHQSKDFQKNDALPDENEEGAMQLLPVSGKADEVQVLGFRNDTKTRNDTMDNEVMELAQHALSIAHAMTKNDEEGEDDSSQSSTISQLQKKTAQKIFQAEEDPDYDSIPDADEENVRNVYKVSGNDQVSVGSAITDLSDNTSNIKYHNVETSDASISDESTFSIQSLKTLDFDQHISASMTQEEVESTIDDVLKRHKMAAQQKANKFLYKRLRQQRESKQDKEGEVAQNESTIKGRQKSDENNIDNFSSQETSKQSASDSEAGEEE